MNLHSSLREHGRVLKPWTRSQVFQSINENTNFISCPNISQWTVTKSSLILKEMRKTVRYFTKPSLFNLMDYYLFEDYVLLIILVLEFYFNKIIVIIAGSLWVLI